MPKALWPAEGGVESPRSRRTMKKVIVAESQEVQGNV